MFLTVSVVLTDACASGVEDVDDGANIEASVDVNYD